MHSLSFACIDFLLFCLYQGLAAALLAFNHVTLVTLAIPLLQAASNQTYLNLLATHLRLSLAIGPIIHLSTSILTYFRQET
jgi:hypothetical protein